MEYLEAVKTVRTTKIKENFMVIELSYSNKIILPYKDGITFLSSLNTAETLKEDYAQPHRIIPFARDMVKTSVMSGEEYEQYKIAALLNISIDEVKEYALKAA